MKYKKVVIKILDEYINYVNKDEINVLINILKIIDSVEDNKISDEIIIFINKILDRIWNLYLTDIKSFKNGNDFSFLTKDIVLYFESNNSSNIIDINNFDYGIITNKNIENKNIEDCGLIIMPNYTNNLRVEPILPSYFKDNKISISNFNYITCGYYAFDTHLNDLDSSISLVKELSNENKLPNILIDKDFYKTKFDNKDFESIHIMFIVEYLFKNYNNNINIIKYRDIFKKNTKEEFKKIYNLLLKKKITIYEFKNLTSDLFEKTANEIELNNGIVSKKIIR